MKAKNSGQTLVLFLYIVIPVALLILCVTYGVLAKTAVADCMERCHPKKARIEEVPFSVADFRCYCDEFRQAPEK